MFNKLTAFLSPYKLYIYVALGAIVVSAWAWDRNAQYTKGVDACQLKQMEAQASYWENRSERLAEEGKAALKEEQRVSTIIATRTGKRAAEVTKSVELSKASPNGACILSDDELLDIQQAIREARITGPLVVSPVSSRSVPRN